MQLQDVIQALGLLPPAVAEQYEESLRHALRAVGQATLSVVKAPTSDGVFAPPPAAPDPAAVVLATAEAEWLRGVAEPGTAGMPNGATVIDGYIRGPQGLAWNTCDVPPKGSWRPNIPYTFNGQFAWCLAGAAFCWCAAGLKLAIRQKHIAGTGRIYSWARGTERMIAPKDARPGDIGIFGPLGSGDGEHGTILRTGPKADGTVDTFEFNAKGKGPAGNTYEGVVTRSRPLAHRTPSVYRLLYCVRPLAEDLEG